MEIALGGFYRVLSLGFWVGGFFWGLGCFLGFHLCFFLVGFWFILFFGFFWSFFLVFFFFGTHSAVVVFPFLPVFPSA